MLDLEEAFLCGIFL